MVWLNRKPKCVFCGKKGGILHSVHAYGMYGDIGKRHFYHDECLQLIECEPEKFGHKVVDMALYINELKEQCISRVNSKIAKEFKEKVETLQAKSFERMMPKKY
jgi:hypothetical protein